MHAVILAGGKGVRLRPYTTRLPKPLVPIGDEFSILDVVLLQLAQQGFSSVTLAIGHLGHLIRAYIGDGSRWGLQINYTTEDAPLGTMGPAVQVQHQLPEEFLVMNGDILTDLNYADLLDSHCRSKDLLTVATYQREVKIDFGVLHSQDNKIVQFTEKPTIDYRVSMCIYGLSRRALQAYLPGTPLGFDDLVLDLIREGTPPREYAFDGYWLDIGRPDDYDRANNEFDTLRPTLLKGE